MPLLVTADSEIFRTGLAPELPEDLYNLIKKVSTFVPPPSLLSLERHR